MRKEFEKPIYTASRSISKSIFFRISAVAGGRDRWNGQNALDASLVKTARILDGRPDLKPGENDGMTFSDCAPRGILSVHLQKAPFTVQRMGRGSGFRKDIVNT